VSQEISLEIQEKYEIVMKMLSNLAKSLEKKGKDYTDFSLFSMDF